MARTKPFTWLIFTLITVEHAQTVKGLQATEIPMEFDSPYYVTVYQVIEGSVSGVSGIFKDPELANLKKGDYFTVVLNIKTQLGNWYRRNKGWYEIPALFCFGDIAAKCLNRAMNASAKYGRPYLFRPTSLEKDIPLMVPFENFTYITTPNGDRLPETGIVHTEFKNFSHSGARYDSTSGVLASFYTKFTSDAGKISDITFVRKKGQLEQQPLTECYLVEWAPDGCVPGLNRLMKGWDMKKLKMKSVRWLKFGKFPLHRDEDYLGTLHSYEKGTKNFLVAKGLFIESVATGSIPYSRVYKSVKEQMEAQVNSFKLGYKEEASGAVQGSVKVEHYSQLFSGRSYTSAVAGVNYKLFSARFRSSFNFSDSANWDDNFKRDLNAILGSRESSKAMDFFSEYGTHYVKEAVMGGRKESTFSVDYCSLEKSSSTKYQFEAAIKIPFEGIHNLSPESTYNKTMMESVKETIVSGPFTTCTGGNSLTLEVCYNDTAWRDSVHIAPYPIELVVKPFWNLLSYKGQKDWLNDQYKKYLVLQLDEEEIKQDLQISAICGDGGVLKACYTAVISAAVVLIVLIH